MRNLLYRASRLGLARLRPSTVATFACEQGGAFPPPVELGGPPDRRASE